MNISAIRRFIIMGALLMLIPSVCMAIPNLISYQGRLTEGGNPVTGDRDMVFSLYTTATGGGSVWSESRTVTVTDGAFKVDLGAVTPVPATAFGTDTVYLGIKVGTDAEMTPRSRLTSVGYAYEAGHAAGADNATNAGYASEAAHASSADDANHADAADTALNADNAALLNSMSSSDIINAASEEVRTPISSLPYTISSSGSYYFTGDLTYSLTTGSAITVSKDNVTIDMMGYSLVGPGNASGTNDGISMDGRNNVEIKNGTVREFGGTGIFEASSSGRYQRVINVRAIGNGSSGIYLWGESCLILNCTASDNGAYGLFVNEACNIAGNTACRNTSTGILAMNGTSITGNTAYSNGGNGIYSEVACLIKDNVVYSNLSVGIRGTYGCEVTGNVVYNNQNSGIDVGDSSTVTGNTVKNNNLTDATFSAGIRTGARCLVKGNTLAYNNKNNIYDSSYCAVEENLTTHSSGYGIYFAAAGSFYANNRARGNTTANYGGTLPTGAGDGGGNASF